ncbi:hypothetical protein RDWZM_003899 [Blomia tropicalis]|uniref:Transcription initiation factor IIF subunit alpha n=1 Tax=Blomia tropicalis TaxID=40697 RepID=A0A9Q0RSZ8_BLOTA|nr:hypothetical protein RDWZM_003899 [Blomia tropicalis]
MAQEYVVRVPREMKKQFSVMRFNTTLGTEDLKFKHCKMERENLFKEVKEEEEVEHPEFGAGSEYGRKEREEARRRKYEKRKNKQNNSPWILKVGGKQGKKFRGVREGGVTENTSYYVFFQAPDGAFEAFPVNEWYKFSPFQRYKALSAEEAEEKFNKRDQILNYFPLKLMNKGKQEDGSVDEPSNKMERTIKKEFKVSDMDDWYQSDNDNVDSENGDSDEEKSKRTKGKGKKDLKNKKDKKRKKKKGSDDDDDDEEPLEDSDEGDYDDKEVDYMSDSSSSSESDLETVDIKGVVDESALRDLVVSEDDEEEEEENKEETNEQTDEANSNKPNELEKKVKVKSEKNANDSSISDSEFDSDNSDLDDSKSALLIQNRKGQKSKGSTIGGDQQSSEQQTSSSSTNESKFANFDSTNGEQSANKAGGSSSSGNGLKFRHKMDNADMSHINKKQKTDKNRNEPSDGITEDAVRRYLMRKPMTCTDLLQKFKNKVHQRDNLVSIIADILKKLSPETQKIKGKMYFSLKPT